MQSIRSKDNDILLKQISLHKETVRAAPIS